MWGKIIGAALLVGLAGAAVEYTQASRQEVEKRKNTPFMFPCYMPPSLFESVAYASIRRIAKGRNLSIRVENHIVYGAIDSQSGASRWSFRLDYNDYGKLTGRYWLFSENDDSTIPKRIGDRIQDEIQSAERDYKLESYSNDTNKNYYPKATTYSSTNAYNAQVSTENNTYTQSAQKKSGTSWGSIFLIAIVISIIVSVYQHFEDKKKMTVIGFDSESVIGIKTEEAVEKINSAGFTNVETKPAKDLDIGHLYDEGRVESISIDDNNSFSSSDEFPYDTDVIINYHSIKEVNPPVSSKEAEGINYKKIVKKLEDAGFVNVKTKAHKDLIIGLLDSDGDVESISIEGDEDYSKSSSYRIDVKVVIKYHTF